MNNHSPYHLYICLRSYAHPDIQDPLSLLVQRLNGWFEPRCDCVDYYIEESLAYMLYLMDPHLKRQASLDYIV